MERNDIVTVAYAGSRERSVGTVTEVTRRSLFIVFDDDQLHLGPIEYQLGRHGMFYRRVGDVECRPIEIRRQS